LEDAYAHGKVDVAAMAALDFALGERNRAKKRLQNSCAAEAAPYLAPSPVLDPLRSDSQIAAALAECTSRRSGRDPRHDQAGNTSPVEPDRD
jgi:hypothetical protein